MSVIIQIGSIKYEYKDSDEVKEDFECWKAEFYKVMQVYKECIIVYKTDFFKDFIFYYHIKGYTCSPDVLIANESGFIRKNNNDNFFYNKIDGISNFTLRYFFYCNNTTFFKVIPYREHGGINIFNYIRILRNISNGR